MNATPRPWGEAEDSALAKHWAEGLSASQIAKKLGTGRSRNAIIGRIHRRGLPGRKTPIGSETIRRLQTIRRRAAILKAVPKIKAEKVPPLATDLNRIKELAPIDPALSVLGLTNFTCRFPIGDPTDPAFTFCGRTCNNVENPYCVQHQKLAYVPVKKRTHDATARLANWLDKRTFKVAA